MLDLGKIGYKVEIDDKKYTAMLKKMEGDAKGTANNIGSVFRKALAFLGGAMLFREGLRGARMFSDELANIKSIAGELNTRALRREITNLSSDLGSSAELANALYFAYSAGVRGTEKELAAFTGQMAALAKTVGAEATPIMDAATTMMNAYGLSVKDAGMLSDWFYQIVKSGKTTGSELAQSLGQIAATAASSGISIDELGAALATLTTTMPTNIAVTSLAASIRALMNPTDDVKKQAAGLGIELSMAAIKAKGFAGVMDDIYQKTGGRGDLIGKLFPAESSRAIMALAGTQINTLKQNILDFGNKSGAAAVGFAEKMKSLDERIKALQVTGKKILTVLADMVVQFVTLGGVLNPVFEWFTKLDERGIALIARMLALVAGLFVIRKAALAYATLRTKVIMAIIAETTATTENTGANVVNATSKEVNTAATGNLTKANISCAAATKALWRAMLANPLTSILALVGVLGTALVLLSDNMEEISKKRLSDASESSNSARESRAQVEEEIRTRKTQIARLDELSQKQRLTNEEQTEAAGIIRKMESAYGDFGASIDKATGKLTLQSEAIKDIMDKLDALKKKKLKDEISASKNELKALDRRYQEKNQSSWTGEALEWMSDRSGILKMVLGKTGKKPFSAGEKGPHKLTDLSDDQINNILANPRNVSDETTQMLKDVLRVRNNLRESQLKFKLAEGGDNPPPENPKPPRLSAEDLKNRDKERENAELNLSNKLASDGELSAADKLLVTEKQIANQEEHINDLTKMRKDAEEDFGENSKEARDALNEQEKAQAQLYAMQNQQVQSKIDYDKQKREQKHREDADKLMIKLRADGEYTLSDQIAVQEQKIAGMAEDAKALRDLLDNPDIKIGDELRRQLEGELNQLTINGYIENTNLKQLKESGQKSQGSFSAELLNLMSGAQAPAAETAENTRKSLQETRKVRENLEKAPVLKYGSK